MKPLLLTVEEAREALGLSRSKFYDLLGTGEIETVHIGTARRVPAEALEKYVAALRANRGVVA